MSGRDHVIGEYITALEQRKRTRAKRRALFAANRCINGPVEDRPSKRTGRVHGPVVPGTGKCEECNTVAAAARDRKVA